MGKELKTKVDTKAELAYVNEELDKKALKSDILVIDEAVTAQESEITTTQNEGDKLVDEIVGYVDGSPRGAYASLSALQSAFPSGAQGVYVCSDNGHWYYWSGTTWTDGGVYQATEIVDGSIDQNKLAIATNILQDYQALNYIKTLSNFSTYGTQPLSIESKSANNEGYLYLNFNSAKEGKIKICILEKNNTTFLIKNIKEFDVIEGWNNIKTDIFVNVGDYIGVVSQSGVSKFYTNNTNEIFHYYKGYVYDDANVGINFTSYTTNSSIIFAWDYMIDEKNGCVSTQNLNNECVTEEKLSKELQNKISFANKKSDISNILYSTTKTIKIKLIGDSITYGQCSTDRANKSWGGLLKNYLENNFNCAVVNSGISGINSSYIRDHISELISNVDDIVICMIGTNNRNNETAYNSLYGDLIYIEQYCTSRGIKFIPMASIPANLTDEATRYKHMNNINYIISSWAKENSYELINLYEEFYKYCDYDNSKLDSLLYDGLHPNDNGYYIIFRIVCEHLGVKAPIKDANW